MADQADTETAKPGTAPKTAQMPRTVHELVTGPKPDQVIASGTFIDDDVAKTHKLTAKEIDRLVDKGAVELVEVHKA